jgi:preprotein translocase subunit YajC
VKTWLIAAAAVTLAGAAPVAAQTLAPGAAIVDTQGQPVGTVVAVAGDAATVRTDRHEIRLPLSSIRAEGNGGVIAMTQAELNAGYDKAVAEMAAALAPGAPIYDPAGGVTGTVGAVEGELVTVKLPSDREVRLPRNAFSLGRRGLLVGVTAAQLEAQLQQGG